MPRNPADPQRHLYVRLPPDLMDTLDETRFYSARRTRRRVSMRAVVEYALRQFTAEIAVNPAVTDAFDKALRALPDDGGSDHVHDTPTLGHV